MEDLIEDIIYKIEKQADKEGVDISIEALDEIRLILEEEWREYDT